MKAKDLMIGDFVLFDGAPAEVGLLSDFDTEIVLFRIGADTPCAEIWDGDDEVVGIPLTDEILKKNFPEPTDGLTWFPEEGGFNCHTYMPICEINAFGLFKYVHELQHALRLCGINKEIIL